MPAVQSEMAHACDDLGYIDTVYVALDWATRLLANMRDDNPLR